VFHEPPKPSSSPNVTALLSKLSSNVVAVAGLKGSLKAECESLNAVKMKRMISFCFSLSKDKATHQLSVSPQANVSIS